MKYDFSGWATRNNLRCSDGRTICKDAFKANDGQTVPLVWNHQHNEPFNVLGHALLENRSDGVYSYCTFNDTESGRAAKQLVEHGDVSALSIYANQLRQQGSNVLHGMIREVSLVLAGANPGAFIESVLSHGEESDEEAVIYTGETILMHSDEQEEETDMNENPKKKGKPEDEETVADVFNTLTEKQKTVVYALIGQALEDQNGGDDDD
ncbi:MAG: HK97 family phage prohead protease, partial [Lachnospiraceae bacterium]|nr:HK97 family phage prohead protease [Lachnospiraceae bacterium]